MRRNILLCLATAVLAGCGPSADDPLPPEDDLYAYSLAVAEKARLKVPPDRYLAVYHIGRVHQRFGMEDKAIEVFREATRLNPRAPEPHRDIGYILSQRKDRMDEALDAYQQSLVADPTQKGIYTRMGMIYIHQSRFEEAVNVLQEEVRRGGASELTRYELGQAYQLQSQHEKALEHFGKVPDMREALYGKFKSLQALGRKEEAAAALKRFREIKDKAAKAEMIADQQAAKTNRGELLEYTAETWEDAAILFIEEVNRETDPPKRERYVKKVLHAMNETLRFNNQHREAYRFLIKHYGQHEMYSSSLDILKRAVDALPGDPVFRYELAALKLHLVERDRSPEQAVPAVEECIGHLERAVELAPEFAEAHFLLAKAILFFKRQRQLIPTALEHAQRALELDENAEASRYDILAMAFHYSGNRERARDTLREGLRRFPEDRDLSARLRRYEEVVP